MGAPRQARPLTGSDALASRCAACSGSPRTRSDVADLEVVWLVADADGKPVAAHFCQDCRPRGLVDEVACQDCGDGPLLSGPFAAEGDLFTTAALQQWLDETGWSHGAVCPRCSALRRGPTGRAISRTAQ